MRSVGIYATSGARFGVCDVNGLVFRRHRHCFVYFKYYRIHAVSIFSGGTPASTLLVVIFLEEERIHN